MSLRVRSPDCLFDSIESPAKLTSILSSRFSMGAPMLKWLGDSPILRANELERSRRVSGRSVLALLSCRS